MRTRPEKGECNASSSMRSWNLLCTPQTQAKIPKRGYSGAPDGQSPGNGLCWQIRIADCIAFYFGPIKSGRHRAPTRSLLASWLAQWRGLIAADVATKLCGVVCVYAQSHAFRGPLAFATPLELACRGPRHRRAGRRLGYRINAVSQVTP